MTRPLKVAANLVQREKQQVAQMPLAKNNALPHLGLGPDAHMQDNPSIIIWRILKATVIHANGHEISGSTTMNKAIEYALIKIVL